MYKFVTTGKYKGTGVFIDDEDAGKVELGELYVYDPSQVRIYVNGDNLILSRYLLDYFGDDEVDHIDHNPLNNYKYNLRVVTKEQNLQNRRKFSTYRGKPTVSQYKGVTYDWLCRKWKAQVGRKGGVVYLGLKNSEIEAAMAYNQAALEIQGDFCVPNVLPQYLHENLFAPMTFENLVRILSAVQDERCIVAAKQFVESIEQLDSVQIPDPSNRKEQLIAAVALKAISRTIHKAPPDWSKEIWIADSDDQADRIDDLLKRL